MEFSRRTIFRLMNTVAPVVTLSILLLIGCSETKETTAPPRTLHRTSSSSITNLEALNSAEDDFAPWLSTRGTLTFTSNRQRQPTQTFIDTKSKFGEQLFVSDGSGVQWSQPQSLHILNESIHNTGTLTTNLDNVAIFAASYREHGVGGTDLWQAQWASMQWGAPGTIASVNSVYWDSHPCITHDGSMLLFASDRTDAAMQTTSQPATDIWMSKRNADGSWSTPVALPPPINSSASEISPFIAADGFLYFATNRFPGSGFDIVRSKFVGGAWSEPEVLAAPINSSDDDCFPFVTNDRARIYFASNRSGGKGGFDIYAAEFPYRIVLRGTVTFTDREQKQFIPAQSVRMTIADLTSQETNAVTTNADGSFEAPLRAGHEYRISSDDAACYESMQPEIIRTVIPISLDTTITRTYALRRIVFPKFELGTYNIPFFVTGYYVPNTPENLRALTHRIASKSLDVAAGGTTPYIDPDDEPYAMYADSIKHIFEHVYTTIEDKILLLFNACASSDEHLLIEVKGFVDPRGLTYGRYVDSTIVTDSMRIDQNSVMQGQEGNRKLANLRAAYTLRMIDREMQQRSAEYRDLLRRGRIRYSAFGAGIDYATNPGMVKDPAKRRIDITLKIIR